MEKAQVQTCWLNAGLAAGAGLPLPSQPPAQVSQNQRHCQHRPARVAQPPSQARLLGDRGVVPAPQVDKSRLRDEKNHLPRQWHRQPRH